MATTKQEQKIPVRVVPREQMLKERQSELREYEKRYEMSSEKMAALLSLDAIRPTAEVLEWYATYQGVKSMLARSATLVV